MSDWLDGIEGHYVDSRQFMGFQQSTLPGGMSLIGAHNSSGLTFSLLPDRGMDIWQAAYKGIPLTWLSLGSPHPVTGSHDWLRQFNGGLLTTCGLTHVGPSEQDSTTGEHRGIHGRYTFQPATAIRQHTDANHATLQCRVAQAGLFGEQLTLERTIRLTRGAPTIALTDTVTNHGDTATPLMLLYHCNMGYPLVRAGTELVVNSAVYPRDARADAGVETWQHYEAATHGYAEQVFFHHVRYAGALFTNGEIGLLFNWDAASLPYLTQWKNTRKGIYVSGVEPGNCIPEGQNAARDAGRLTSIAPGQSQTFKLQLSVLEGEAALSAAAEQIQSQDHDLIAGTHLTDYHGDENR